MLNCRFCLVGFRGRKLSISRFAREMQTDSLSPISSQKSPRDNEAEEDDEIQDARVDLQGLHLVEQSSFIIGQKRSISEREGKCLKCFMFKAYCMCNTIKAMFQPALDDPNSVTSQIHFCLFMHYKEWGRASNTGKLLNIGLGDERAGIYIFGQPDQERELIQQLRSKPSLILYPNRNAKQITDYKDMIQEAHSRGEAVQLCVIDTTWSLSAAMDRNLPDDIPRVMIDKDFITGPSRFLNRKQNIHKHKVSTIEAVALALQSFLPEATTQATVLENVDAAQDESSEDLLPSELVCYRTALEYSVDSVLKQAGKPIAYGHDVRPQFDEIRRPNADRIHFGPVSRPVMDKPLACLYCGKQRADENGNVVDHTINFKNFGKKWRKFVLSELRSDLVSPRVVSITEHPENVFLRQLAMEQLKAGRKIYEAEDRLEVEFRMWRCSSCRDFFPCRV